MRRIDVVGRKFGMLTPVEELPAQGGMRRWRLKCDCGSDHIAFQKAFASGGKMRSCGCDSRMQTLHGLSKTAEYRHWINMLSRCNNPNTPGYELYGGRGIKVCARWTDSFSNFYADMGPRPSSGHSIDRYPNKDGNYEPGNCRWATPSEQSRNRRGNRQITIGSAPFPVSLAEAADNAPVPYNTVLHRILRGWSIADAVSRPSQKGRRP